MEADLTAPGHPEIFVIGDTATINAWQGKPVPGIAPAAKQQGAHVARTIRARLDGDFAPRMFRYLHSGNLATIGKSAAVIDFGWIKMRGGLAWWIWGLAHIYFLIGVRNRLAVASWLWIHTTGSRNAASSLRGMSAIGIMIRPSTNRNANLAVRRSVLSLGRRRDVVAGTA